MEKLFRPELATLKKGTLEYSMLSPDQQRVAERMNFILDQIDIELGKRALDAQELPQAASKLLRSINIEVSLIKGQLLASAVIADDSRLAGLEKLAEKFIASLGSIGSINQIKQ